MLSVLLVKQYVLHCHLTNKAYFSAIIIVKNIYIYLSLLILKYFTGITWAVSDMWWDREMAESGGSRCVVLHIVFSYSTWWVRWKGRMVLWPV